jgi:hypothetical protein
MHNSLTYIVRKWSLPVSHDPEAFLDETIKILRITLVELLPRDPGF